ncbi:uncharacterized protein LOC132860735 [Tachysurus vachellii]|uniref:uncharacterized protein LOC132860735 n=1 Tax=Tachysurus vachellii TaxID=175792 RepID=UPI00296AFFD1|nr:uncharacterized protein LOC132860735 [Tachysurus vachellii]
MCARSPVLRGWSLCVRVQDTLFTESVDVVRDPPPSVLQVIEPKVQLPPTEPHHDTSSVVLFSQHPCAGELDRACGDDQFLSTNCFSSQSESMDVNKDSLEMISGPGSRLCLFEATETHSFSLEVHEQYLQLPPAALHSDPLAVIPETCTYLHAAADGQLDTCTWESKDLRSPHGDAQADSEECEETPEEVEVPFISCHLSQRGVTEVGMKLPALRQAFATLLASIHNQNFFFVAGKKIVMRLAAANNKEVHHVQLAYEALIQFLRTPSNQESIAAELSGANIHNYNFVDVFYELLVFGYVINGSEPETFAGAFLERLIALVNMWDADVWEPAAALCFAEVIDQLKEFFDDLFALPRDLYSDPAALAPEVCRLLVQHVQLLMDTLETL